MRIAFSRELSAVPTAPLPPALTQEVNADLSNRLTSPTALRAKATRCTNTIQNACERQNFNYCNHILSNLSFRIKVSLKQACLLARQVFGRAILIGEPANYLEGIFCNFTACVSSTRVALESFNFTRQPLQSATAGQ